LVTTDFCYTSSLCLQTMNEDNNRLYDKIFTSIGLPAAFFLLLPLVVYVTNLNAVAVEKDSILLLGGLATLVAGTILFILFSVPKLGAIVLALSQLILVYVFLTTIFPNTTGELTGFTVSQSMTMTSIDFLKSGLILFLGVLFLWRRQNEFNLVLKSISILVIVFCLIFSLFFTSVADKFHLADTESKTSLLELGSESNILVIVLDAFTGYRFLEITEEKQHLVEKFEGFTFYPRCIGVANNTPAGSSTILTGGINLAVKDIGWENRNSKSVQESFLNSATKNGYAASYISALTIEDGLVPWAPEQSFFTAANLNFKSTFHSYTEFLEVSTTRIFPVQLLNYNDGNGTPLSKFEHQIEDDATILEQLSSPSVWVPLRSRMAFEFLLENISKSSKIEKKVIFFHSKISHREWNFSEDGKFTLGLAGGARSTAHYVVNMVDNLLEKLRELKSYDNSFIIITADHGGMVELDKTMGGLFTQEKHLSRLYNPLLLIKPKQSNEPMRTSEMTVWLGDIYPTINHMLGMNYEMSGSRSLLLPEDVNRKLDVPLFVKSSPGLSWHSALIYWDRFEVQGSFKDYGSAELSAQK